MAPLSREIDLPEQAIARAINGDAMREGNATLFEAALRRLGFVGVSGLERQTLAALPTADPLGKGCAS